MASSATLWALIVGINEYQDPTLDNLEHAVSDAHAMHHFLVGNLCVPESHICTLTDQRATYASIIRAFERHFITNARVRHGDPLLFYFAGRGSRYSRGTNDPETDNPFWEALCPSDRNTNAESGVARYDIADSTLGRLLGALVAKKGNNITVIMDCCHVGSNTHPGAGKHSRLRSRWAPPIQDEEAVRGMRDDPEGLNVLSLGAAQGRVGPTVWCEATRQAVHHAAGKSAWRRDEHLKTHVLLTACRQSEQAYEDIDASSGLFTSALLSELNTDHLPQLTYDGLIARVLARMSARMGQLIQQPQGEGTNKQCAIFRGRAIGLNRRLVPITLFPDGKLRVEAGAIHGIAVGAEFSVWPNRNATIDPSKGKLIATYISSVYSFVMAESGFAPQHGWYAGVSWWTNAGNQPFPIYVTIKEKLVQDACVLQERLEPRRSDQWHDGLEVAVVLKKEIVPLISANDRVVRVGMTDQSAEAVEIELPYRSRRNGMELVNRILRFEIHLARTKPTEPLRRTLDFTIVRVDAVGTPVSRNLFDKLHRAFLPNDGAKHHFIVTNKCLKPLWLFVYYFDPATHTVSKLYVPPSNTMEPPLKPNNKLVIGNDKSGVKPFSLVVKTGQNKVSGFAKLFVSETYTDLAMLEEQDEFFYVDPRRTREGKTLGSNGVWDTILTTITVRR